MHRCYEGASRSRAAWRPGATFSVLTLALVTRHNAAACSLILFSILVEAKSPLLIWFSILLEAKSNMFIYWLSIPIGYYPHYLGMDNLDADDYWVWVRVTHLLPNGIVWCGATTGWENYHHQVHPLPQTGITLAAEIEPPRNIIFSWRSY